MTTCEVYKNRIILPTEEYDWLIKFCKSFNLKIHKKVIFKKINKKDPEQEEYVQKIINNNQFDINNLTLILIKEQKFFDVGIFVILSLDKFKPLYNKYKNLRAFE